MRSNLRDATLRASIANVAKGIHGTSNDPDGTCNGGGYGVAETSDGQATKERAVVLNEVGMGTLG